MVKIGALKYFYAIITIQLVYSFCVTILVWGLSGYNLQTMTLAMQPFQNQTINPSALSSQIQSATQSQLHIPLIDLGSLVFYSGNLIFDLIVNFFTALPGMFNLLVDALCLLFNVPVFLANTLKVAIFTMLSISYFIALISFILSIRSRGATIQ